MVIQDLRQKIKQIEEYLGPCINYSSEEWAKTLPEVWLQEYHILLKTELYKRVHKNNARRLKARNKPIPAQGVESTHGN